MISYVKQQITHEIKINNKSWENEKLKKNKISTI